MSGWLAGRRVRFVGQAADVAHAVAEQGGLLVAEDACDILIHIAAPPPVCLIPLLSIILIYPPQIFLIRQL